MAAVTQTRLAGHWPFAEVRYEEDALPVRVSLQAWTPVIPGDANDSNIPVALFELTLTNPAGQPIDVGTAMTGTRQIRVKVYPKGSPPNLELHRTNSRFKTYSP